MNFDLTQWVLAGLATLVVGLSKTGVPGVSMLSVAIFANLLPTKQASGFVLPLLLCGDLVAVFSYRRHTEWKHLRRLFVWTGAGVVLGALALGRIDDRQARLLVGGIVVALVGLHLWRKRGAGGVSETEHGVWFAPTIGVLAGFTTLVANAAGPLMAIYLPLASPPPASFAAQSCLTFFDAMGCSPPASPQQQFQSSRRAQ